MNKTIDATKSPTHPDIYNDLKDENARMSDILVEHIDAMKVIEILLTENTYLREELERYAMNEFEEKPGERARKALSPKRNAEKIK